MSLKIDAIIKSAIEKSDSVRIVKKDDGTGWLQCERKPTKQNPFGGKAEYPINITCKAKNFSFELAPKIEPHVESVIKGVFVNDTVSVSVEEYSSKGESKVNAVFVDCLRNHVKSKEPSKIRFLVGCSFA